jgi:hypothetical protein
MRQEIEELCALSTDLDKADIFKIVPPHFGAVAKKA